MNLRGYKSARRAIWDSFNGCECRPEAKRDDKCSARVVRCNGRLGVIADRMTKLEDEHPELHAQFEASRAKGAEAP